MGTARRIAERFRAQLDELVMAEEALRAQDPNVQDGGPGWDAALAEFTKMVEEAFGDEIAAGEHSIEEVVAAAASIRREALRLRWIREDRMELLDAAFAQAAKLAAKVGVPAPSYRVEAEEVRPLTPRTDIDRQRIALGDPTYPLVRWIGIRVHGAAVRVPGFAFVGKVEPSAIAGLNFVGVLPGATIDPAPYRAVPIACEHCATRRSRKATYLILSEDTGRVFMVGRSCLRDFTGHASPEQLARLAEFGFSVDGFGGEPSDEDEQFGGGYGSYGRARWSLLGFLSMAAAVTEEHGFVPAKAETGYSTRDRVMDALGRRGVYDPKRRDPEPVPAITAEHKARAAGALAWIRSLPADPVILRNDYLFNLRLACEPELLDPKRAGLLASLLGAWDREMQRTREKAARAAEQAPAVPVPQSDERIAVEGRIATIREDATDFGMQLRCLLICRAGEGEFKLWGSLPSAALGAKIGDTLRFMAKVERSQKDEAFGFYKRPTKVEWIPAPEAAAPAAA